VHGWQTALPGTLGPLAAGGGLVGAVLALTGSAAIPPGAVIELRGEPGAAVVALDAVTGAPKWRVTFDASEFAVISAIAPATAGGFVVGGSFSGTLRAGDAVVSSAGKSDGFVALVGPTGAVAWLVRLGGPGADAVQGVAMRADRVAIAGTFAAGAELGGVALPPFEDRSPLADAFVAELDAAGARRWAITFGGKADDSVAGVAIDTSGRVAVAANARGTMHVGSTEVHAHGAADGLVVWVSPGGELGVTTLLGGPDFDGLRAIAAVDDRVVVGGFFSGTATLGATTLAAGGGDDAFLATIDATGAVGHAWQVGGAGREEIIGISAIPGGFVAAVGHTAELVVGTDRLAAPTDPSAGAALVVRPAP
jgi:outer membrane protein assembly factor BamB